MIDMYASDLTHKKRAEAVFRNLQLQKEWFASGGTIRILGQKGGNDYAYMTHVEEGCIADKCWQLYVAKQNKAGNGPVPGSTDGMTQFDFTDSSGNIILTDSCGNLITEFGYGSPVQSIVDTFDDASIPIPMGGMDFYFNGINYGAIPNAIKWNSNNALVFGFDPQGDVSINPAPGGPAILMGNYDRIVSSAYYSNYSTSDNGFRITMLRVSFSNYYTDTTNLSVGQLQIRLIKENAGDKRQWVEVTVISAPTSPGYSNDPTVTYPSGTKDVSGNLINQDSNGNEIDPTKFSPWDVTDGIQFLQIAGNSYSTAFPVAGTTILYESNKEGNGWRFTKNAYFPI